MTVMQQIRAQASVRLADAIAPLEDLLARELHDAPDDAYMGQPGDGCARLTVRQLRDLVSAVRAGRAALGVSP